MEELLESFVTSALGLELKSRIQDASQLPELRVGLDDHSQDRGRICASWDTSQKRVTICATYHSGHSQRMKAHVVWLEWWIPPQIHHEGWWRVESKWRRDWIKGHD